MLLAFLLSLLGGLVLTGLVRRYALARSVLDIPNGRSSHTVPTPRGGGLSLVLVLPLLVGAGWYQGWLELTVAVALSAGMLLLAVVGFVDDHRPLSARLRFVLQALAALSGMLLLPALPHLPVVGFELPGWLLFPLLWLALVWLTNLYNFMDGIDGIAAVESVTVLLAGALLLAQAGEPSWQLLLLLCAPLLGFLYWNFPAAKIFMGDVGSAPLGLFLGVLAFWLAAQTAVNLWCWLILLSVFVVDATWTLLVRMLTGQRWSEPHRSHSYQILARRWGSHVPVTLRAGAINLGWLLPLAWLAMHYPTLGGLIWLVAIAPLLWVCWTLKAGRPTAG